MGQVLGQKMGQGMARGYVSLGKASWKVGKQINYCSVLYSEIDQLIILKYCIIALL